MKKRIHIIIFLLCVCLVGFFANFAQNDYGLTMVHYGLLAVGVLFLDMMRLSILKYKIAGYFVHLMVLFPVLSLFADLNDLSEEFLMGYVFSMFAGFIFNSIVLPVALFFKERKSGSNDISFLRYYELLFLCLLLIGLYLKSNHYPGASVLMVLSMLMIIPAFIRLIQLVKLLLQGQYLSAFFQLLVCIFVPLCIVGSVFKFQHWPGADLILFITMPIMFISFVILILISYWKKQGTLFSHTNSAIKTAYFSFCTIILWLVLRYAGVAPSVYSDRYPKGMQILGANANNVTKEGKEFEKRYEIYEENLDRFVEEQNKAEK
jgi:hypothetical protein